MRSDNMKDKKRYIAVVIVALTLLASIILALILDSNRTAQVKQDALKQYWTQDSAVSRELVDYVSMVTDPEDTENYIPDKDRIAVFDMDGTLTCETYYTYYDTMNIIVS